MSASIKSLEELVSELPPQLKIEVQAFVEALLIKSSIKSNDKSSQTVMPKLRQDWANTLKADHYTSVELQHLAVEWRKS
jgi:hypothetical protein